MQSVSSAEICDSDLRKLEDILQYAPERYVDTVTHRIIVVGRHDKRLVSIPYEQHDDSIIPVTVHVVSRQQITYRVKTRRLIMYE